MFKLYDQNGRIKNLETIKLTPQLKSGGTFAYVNDKNNCQCISDRNMIKDFIEMKKQQRIRKLRENEQFRKKENSKKKGEFEVPELFIENNIENEKRIDTVDKENMLNFENNLKISNEDLFSTKKDEKVYKLQIGVADFTKKVKDNEGMGISTFSDENEIEAKGIGKKDIFKTNKNVFSSPIPFRNFIDICAKATEIRRRSHMKRKTPMEKLLRGIRITALLNKTCQILSQQSEQKNKTFATFADYQESNSEPKSVILFDVTSFKARMECTLSADGVRILMIDPKSRTSEMVHCALLAVNSTVDGFGEFPLSMQTNLIKRGWYEKFESKRVIIRQGHHALNFYFIISGIATVSVARNNKSTNEIYFETVAFLKKGNSFGELALLFGGKRSATVSCKTDVELLAVSRQDFIEIFMNYSDKEEPEHIAFLRNIPLLDQWPVNDLPYDDPSIFLFSYFRRGTVLCEDSNFDNWVYIVKSGTCRIIKLVQLDKQYQIDKLKMFKESNENLKFVYQYNNNCSRTSLNDEVFFSELKFSTKINGYFYILLKILDVGDVFGLEPIAFEYVGGTTGVTLVSDGCELLVIERKFFRAHITTQYQSWLRKELQPFPSSENLKEKLINFYHWENYKETIMKPIIFPKLNY